MVTHILLLIVGLTLIIAGGNFVTNGAVAIADKLKMSPLLIGLTVVAFGSSTPDLVVSMYSTVQGHSVLAVGNILGAVIFDMLLVVGLLSLIRPLKTERSTLWCDMPVMMLGAFIVFVCAENKLFDHQGIDGITRVEGLLMVACFIVFMVYTIKTSRRPEMTHTAESHSKVVNQKNKPMGIPLAILCVVGGLVALVYGGQWTVNAASDIARVVGMSEGLIGLTIVGIGSSLPDLATSVIAAVKGQSNLALGNIIGSCIMDIIMVLGVCAVVSPLSVAGISIVDFATLLGASVLLFVMPLLSKSHSIGRADGAILVLLYVAYVCYLVFTH